MENTQLYYCVGDSMPVWCPLNSLLHNTGQMTVTTDDQSIVIRPIRLRKCQQASLMSHQSLSDNGMIASITYSTQPTPPIQKLGSDSCIFESHGLPSGFSFR